MIPLCICVGAIALVFWLANRYERHIRVLAKRYEPKIKITADDAKAMVEACDLIMEIHTDPQSDEYRSAMELKLRLERRIP